MTLRAYARHRNVAPSYIHRLLTHYGRIKRNADGLIDPAEADAILDEHAQLMSPLVAAANARQRANRCTRPTPTPETEGLLDSAFSDAVISALRDPLFEHQRPDVSDLDHWLRQWQHRLTHRLVHEIGGAWGRCWDHVDAATAELAAELGTRVAIDKTRLTSTNHDSHLPASPEKDER